MTTLHLACASASPLPVPRRGFLRGLISLPLIGGGLTLVGQPRAVAEPVTPDLLEAYKTWLAMEHRFLTSQMADDPIFIERYRDCYGAGADQKARRAEITRYEWFVGESNSGHEKPYDRAALVLSAVGCDWREDA